MIIHGVLHLCGINDKGPGERELMEAAENKALKTLPLPSLREGANSPEGSIFQTNDTYEQFFKRPRGN